MHVPAVSPCFQERLRQLKSPGFRLWRVSKALFGVYPSPTLPCNTTHGLSGAPALHPRPSDASPRGGQQVPTHKLDPVQRRGWCCPTGSVHPARSLHSSDPEKLLLQTDFPAAPPIEDFATFPGEGTVCMVVPTPLPAGSRGTEKPLLCPCPHTADSASLLVRESLVKAEGRKRLLAGFVCWSQEWSR